MARNFTNLLWIKVNSLVRYLSINILSAACLWAVMFIIPLANVYSSDNTGSGRADIPLTRLIDYLSYSYKGFDIQISGISVGETFDDNITYARKNKKEDFITLAGLGIGAKYEGRTRSFELTGNVTQRMYAKNSNFDNTTEEVALNFSNEFSEHARMSLSNVFIHSNEPLFNRGNFFDEQFGRRGGQFEHFRNRFDINYTRDFTRQLTIIARYGNSLDIFSGVDLQDSFLNNAGFEANYLLSATTTFLLSYDFVYREFEDNESASINTVATGIRQYITRKLYFDIRPGLDFIDSFDDENLTKPVIMTSLTYQKDTDTIARLIFEKKYDTNVYNEDIVNRWRTTASVTRQLMERLRCSLSIFYSEGEFISSDFKNRLLGANSTINYDITKILKGNFTYTYSHSDTNSETTGYTKNTVFLGLTAEF